jgi:small conductance mechanosensitive channel
VDNFIQTLQNIATNFGLKIIAAIAIFILGRWAAKLVTSAVKRLLLKRNVDPTLSSFLTNLVFILLLVFVILASLNQLGIETTSLVAILGAVGLAVAFALQGSLSNFASGVLMIIFRPFKVGDYIEGGGTAGIVEEIHIFTTKLRSPDNKEIIVPNSKITGDNIINYSAKETRRIDMVVGVGYNDDLKKVKNVLTEIISGDERILKDPAPTIAVSELGDSSVNFVVRPWVKTADYWDVKFHLTETIKMKFDAEGISIPFPQRDVHLFQNEN